MLTGIYSSAYGMMAQLDRHEVIANNLANVNTTGFKRTAAAFSSFSAYLNNASPKLQPCDITRVRTAQDNRPGAIRDTAIPTNMALEGPGAFVVQSPEGQRLVRNGDFHLDGDGNLLTNSGYPVLGEHGPIKVTGSDFSVDSKGNITSNGAVVDKLKINGASDGKGQTVSTEVIGGSLEVSNVNTVEEMVSMLTALRAYEANQKSLMAIDETLDKAINQMGKTG